MTGETKFRFAAAIPAVLSMAEVGAWFAVSAPGLCGNDVLSENISPSGHWKAVVSERSCGATTGFSTQVSGASDKEWVVQYSKYYPPIQKTANVGGVRVTYEQLQ